jgi:dUTP pyrophosphatase
VEHVEKKTKIVDNNALLVKLLSSNATMPSKGSVDSAGYDLYASDEVIIKSKDRALVPTDISIALPPGIVNA